MQSPNYDYYFHSFWIESPQYPKRKINVLCPFEDAVQYSIHPAPDEHVTPRKASFSEQLWTRFFASERPSRNELIDFFEGLRRCLKIGLSILESIDMLVDSAKSPTFRGIIASIHLKMKEGDTLSQSMERFPKAFDPFVIASIAAAEEAGNLPESLDKITYAMTQANQLKKQLIAGLVYPAIVVAMGVCVVVLLSFTLIPATAKNFMKFGADIPWYSLAVANAATIIRNYWWAVPPMLIGGFLFKGPVVNLWHSKAIQRALVKTPILSPVVRGLALSRVLRTIGTLLGCGVDVRTSFQLTAAAAGHPDYEKYVDNIAKHVLNGDEYYEAFLRERHLVGKDGQRIANYMLIGSKTGDISAILDSLANVQEEDAFRKTEKLPKILEPIIMAALAGVIGIVMASVYLPTLLLAQEVIKSR